MLVLQDESKATSSYVQVYLFALFTLKLADHEEVRAYLAHT